MEKKEFESRVERAAATFAEGYNCAQSVFSTYADCFGMDHRTGGDGASDVQCHGCGSGQNAGSVRGSVIHGHAGRAERGQCRSA